MPAGAQAEPFLFAAREEAMLGARRGYGLAVCLWVVFLLGACSPSTVSPAGSKPGAPVAAVAATEGTAPPPRVAMKAAYTATASSMAPMWLAKEQGLFADQGLDVELVLVQP